MPRFRVHPASRRPHFSSLTAKLAALTMAAAALGGCGDSDTPNNQLDDPCVAMAESCLVDQKACVIDAGVASCQPCEPGSYATAEAKCAPLDGETFSHSFPETTTAAGSETLGMCRSWTLNNPEPLWINAVELQQNEASHHSNWTFVPDDEYAGEDGIWPCKDREYSQLAAALKGGVLYAQSTQAQHEVQKFPAGVAVKIPANARIISDIHTLNSSPDEVTGKTTVTLYSLPANEVTVELVPFHLTYDGLDIPPQSTSRFTGECDLEPQYQLNTEKPLDLKVYYMLPHTHALGTRMFVEAMGGQHEGRTLIDVRGFNGEARGRSYDPPIDLAGATGLRFGCEFENPRAESVGWGFDDQEMCETLGFAATPIAFESRVDTAESTGDDNGIFTFSGECSTISFPWQ